MFSYNRLAFLALSLALLAADASGISAQTVEKPEAQGCPLSIAVQHVDEFVEKSSAELSEASTESLQTMSKYINKANKPGIAIKDQLSQSDIKQFQDARHRNILLGAEKIEYGALKRDVHLLESLHDIVKYVDMYELKKEQLGGDSPLRFYYTILEALRIAQPRVSATPMINVGIECDPEAGLFWEETFYENQLTQNGADQHIVNMIFDLERIRTLYQLDWNLFKNGLNDMKGIKWNNDKAISPHSMDE